MEVNVLHTVLALQGFLLLLSRWFRGPPKPAVAGRLYFCRCALWKRGGSCLFTYSCLTESKTNNTNYQCARFNVPRIIGVYTGLVAKGAFADCEKISLGKTKCKTQCVYLMYVITYVRCIGFDGLCTTEMETTSISNVSSPCFETHQFVQWPSPKCCYPYCLGSTSRYPQDKDHV